MPDIAMIHPGNSPAAPSSMPRRSFLKTSVGFAAASALGAASLSASTYKRSIGANDRIRIAQIGCGNRGLRAMAVCW